MSWFCSHRFSKNWIRLNVAVWVSLSGLDGLLQADDATCFGVQSLVPRPEKVVAWEKWTGESVQAVGETLHAATWADFASEGGNKGLGNISQRGNDVSRGGKKNSSSRSLLELSIPLFPDRATEQDPPFYELDGRWKKGATGQYNKHFVRLAETLVASGRGDAHLRPASNFNLPSYRSDWGIRDQPEHWECFRDYWRQIHRSMMSVEGADFTWVWNVALDGDQRRTEPLDYGWPGDEFVDVVSVSVFDESGDYYWQRYESEFSDHDWNRLRRWAWETVEFGWVRDPYTGELVGEDALCLNRALHFAKAHGKEFAISEWGIVNGNRYPTQDRWGGNDNPMFIELMARWIAEREVKYALYQEELLYSPESGVIDQSILPNFWNQKRVNVPFISTDEVGSPLSSLQYLECFHERLPDGYVEEDFIPYLSLLHETFENGIGSEWKLDGGWRALREALHIDNTSGNYPRTAECRGPAVEECVVTFDLVVAEQGEGVSVEAGRWKVSIRVLDGGNLGLLRLIDEELGTVVATNAVTTPLLIGETYVSISIDVRKGGVFVRAGEELVIAHQTDADEDLFRSLRVTAEAGARLFVQSIDVSVEVTHGDGVAVLPPQ